MLFDKFQALRLKALLIAPTSFSSTHQIESALSDTEWIGRLTADDKETFVCAATTVQNSHSPDTGETDLLPKDIS